MLSRFATMFLTVLFATYTLSADEPVKASKKDTVKDHRYMESAATLYKNGKLVLETKSWSRKSLHGLKGQSVFIVCVDDKGNAIWASKAFKCTTVGGTKDVGTSPEHKDVHGEVFPEVIGKYTKSMDIFHDAGDISRNRQSQVDDIIEAGKAGGEIIKEIKDVIVESLK
jgi:hypothetical protein